MLHAFKSESTGILEQVNKAVNNVKVDLDFLRHDAQAWALCDDISIDYAVMESVQNLVCFPFAAGWSDLGDGDAVFAQMHHQEAKLAVSKNAHAINCEDTRIRSETNDI